MVAELKTNYVLWAINVIVLTFLSLLSWNANRLCDAVDGQQVDIQVLQRESVRWQLVAEDVREMKADVKRILVKVQP